MLPFFHLSYFISHHHGTQSERGRWEAENAPKLLHQGRCEGEALTVEAGIQAKGASIRGRAHRSTAYAEVEAAFYEGIVLIWSCDELDFVSSGYQ